MIRGLNMRSGYCRAAAGVMGCVLLGGALGISTQAKADLTTAAVSLAHTPSVAAQPNALAGGSESPAYLSLKHELARAHFTRQAKSYRVITYTVGTGDTLSEVSQAYNTDVLAITSLNPDLDPDYIRSGEVIKLVPNLHGLVYRVQPGDTLDFIAQLYGVSIDEIQAANGLETDSVLQIGTSLILPGARKANPSTASRGGFTRRSATVATSPTGGAWYWPISGGIYSTEFGAHHAGLDIAIASGTTVAAAHSGTVSFAGWDGGYGYCVIVDHGDGVQTRYAHASVLLVKVGQQLQAMDPVIKVGSTGNSTGPHLHFEVLLNGVPENPRHYLP